MDIKNNFINSQLDINKQMLSNSNIASTNIDIQKIGIKNAGKDFEAMFLTQMFNLMFEQKDPDALFGGGSAEKTFRSLLSDEYGKLISESNKLGIAEPINRQLQKYMEVNNGRNTKTNK
jgi:Rod binding domain-containing protein